MNGERGFEQDWKSVESKGKNRWNGYLTCCGEVTWFMIAGQHDVIYYPGMVLGGPVGQIYILAWLDGGLHAVMSCNKSAVVLPVDHGSCLLRRS